MGALLGGPEGLIAFLALVIVGLLSGGAPALARVPVRIARETWKRRIG